jgi:hypothetical protein
MKLLQPKLGRYCMLQQILQIMILSQALLRIANLFNSLLQITASLLIHCYRITTILLQIVLIVVQLLRIATKLPIPYYTITTQLLQIVFNVIQLLRITTVHYYTITANYSIITTNYYVIITTNYYIWWFHYYILFRKVIRSNETITTYYFPGQPGDEGKRSPT